MGNSGQKLLENVEWLWVVTYLLNSTNGTFSKRHFFKYVWGVPLFVELLMPFMKCYSLKYFPKLNIQFSQVVISLVMLRKKELYILQTFTTFFLYYTFNIFPINNKQNKYCAWEIQITENRMDLVQSTPFFYYVIRVMKLKINSVYIYYKCNILTDINYTNSRKSNISVQTCYFFSLLKSALEYRLDMKLWFQRISALWNRFEFLMIY